jgi:hypothetical protein
MQLDTFYNITEQVELFLLSILLGAALGVVFDAFRLLRAVFETARKSFLVHLADFLYICFYSFAVFTYAAVMARGEVRLFFVIGSICGFLLETLTIGDTVTSIVRYISDKIHAGIRRLWAYILKLFKKNQLN